MKTQNDSDSKTFNQLLDALCEEAGHILRARYASIWLKDGKYLRLRASHGYQDEIEKENLFYHLGEGLTGHIANGHPFRATVADIKKNPEWKGKYDRIQWPKGHKDQPVCFLGVPILLNKTPIGVIKVENKKGRKSFSECDQTMLEKMAELISNAIATESELSKCACGPYAFILMPFGDEFTDIYESGIREACIKSSVRCERVDEIEFNTGILDEIYKGIQRADLVIADMTGRNPNVFYEVGYAHALNKEVILLTQNVSDIPFDLKGHNHLVYGGRANKLKAQLIRRFRSMYSNKASS